MDDSQIRRRVKAARALAGLSVGELAERLDQPGLGERTLRALEGESGRAFRRIELVAIAEACDLPYEFFTVDFARLASVNVGDRLTALEDEVKRLAAERSYPAPPGELGHRAEDSQPSAEHHQPAENPEAGDQPQGAEG